MKARRTWDRLVVVDFDKVEGRLVVNVGANEPSLLFKGEAKDFAIEEAKKKGYGIFIDIEDDARLYGQNNLAERMFYFGK